MAVSQELANALARVDSETNAVAATVASLRALISTHMTPAEVTTVQTKLTEIADRLKATAADPAVPIPPGPPPAPVPVP